MPLRLGAIINEDVLSQRRRELPTIITQRLQLLVQNRVIGQVLATRATVTPPAVLKLFSAFPSYVAFRRGLLACAFAPSTCTCPPPCETLRRTGVPEMDRTNFREAVGWAR